MSKDSALVLALLLLGSWSEKWGTGARGSEGQRLAFVRWRHTSCRYLGVVPLQEVFVYLVHRQPPDIS